MSLTFQWKAPVRKRLISIDTFITIGYVKKIVFLMMFLIQSSHGGTGRRNNIIDKEKKCILWSEVDSFTDQEVKLANSEV